MIDRGTRSSREPYTRQAKYKYFERYGPIGREQHPHHRGKHD
jgi:hypothetical protein